MSSLPVLKKTTINLVSPEWINWKNFFYICLEKYFLWNLFNNKEQEHIFSIIYRIKLQVTRTCTFITKLASVITILQLTSVT